MSKFVSIAIDGPAGAGKSTMAKACAKELGYLYVDTGAIYRTVGYYMRLMGVGPKDKDGIARLIDEVNIDIRYEDGVQHMLLNGADVTGRSAPPKCPCTPPACPRSRACARFCSTCSGSLPGRTTSSWTAATSARSCCRRPM